MPMPWRRRAAPRPRACSPRVEGGRRSPSESLLEDQTDLVTSSTAVPDRVESVAVAEETLRPPRRPEAEAGADSAEAMQIGRASCRERVWRSGVAGAAAD